MTENLGPRRAYQSETTSSAAPVAARAGGHFGASSYKRPLAGLITVLVILGIVLLAAGLFAGSFTKTVPLSLISDRAGLVMNPDAKVKMRGVVVGRVGNIETLPDGKAKLQLNMDPEALKLIPANTQAQIASSTVFGAKFVELVAPQNPSAQKMQPGTVLDGQHVTVEVNTVFQQLRNVLDKIDPVKLNQTLGALSSAFGGRGEKMGQTLTDFNAMLGKLNPSLQNMATDTEYTAAVANAYADAAQDLVTVVDRATTISNSIVDNQQNLDAFLVNMIGLADTGNDVLGSNQPALAKTLQLLTPTTALLKEYGPGITCAMQGMLFFLDQPPQFDPGAQVDVGFTLAIDRYRYPQNLPKVAGKGGPHCMGLPQIPQGYKSKYLVLDSGANPWQYGNQGILLNSDGLKQMLFGPIDGPPRNTAQMGQPG